MPSSDLLDRLTRALGDASVDVLTEEGDTAPFLTDWTDGWHGHAFAVARPRTTAEVSAVVRAAGDLGVAVVAQGGNTGLTGGSAGGADRPVLLLSLQRLRAIRAVEPDTPAVIAEAGCVLAAVQAVVGEHGLQIPLGLGSEGSATIGGLVSTNAGGIRALRHGVMRAQVLGLEVVLADGRVWNGLRTVFKNNMGYDLKQLFVGGEGTLGIVTAAALRLTPAWCAVETVLVGVDDPAAALALLGALRAALGDQVVACELIQRWGVALAEATAPDLVPPLAGEHPWYVLVEVATSGAGVDLRAPFEAALADMLAAGLIRDAALAENEAQRAALWRLREAVVDGKRAAGPGVNVDVAVPPGAVGRFIDDACRAAVTVAPGCRTLAFGHVGDGNMHFSVHASEDGTALPVDAVADVVHRAALSLGGSICAEHGVGRKMLAAVAAATDPVERELQWRVKQALDPDNRLNPGAVIVAPAAKGEAYGPA